jgi:cation diffusion facilitator CzcD-associated flavoprotein CzcO
MIPNDGSESFDTIIIGGGQAGLAMEYHLAKLGDRS